MPKHIFINSHDLDTSIIKAQLVNGKGRYTDIRGSCFGYKFENKQLNRFDMPESIRDKISDEWLDAQNLIKFESNPLSFNDGDLISTGITDEEADILNAMPEGTYFWNTRHVSEMFQNIDKIKDAYIVQLIAHKYEPYFKLLIQWQLLEKGGEFFTSTIDSLLEELVSSIHGTNNCAIGLVEDGYDERLVFCDYETMFDAELFANNVAEPIGITVNEKRNKKVIADYLEENMGAIVHASDEEIDKTDWSSLTELEEKIVSPVIRHEMKRAYISDKKYFTEQNNNMQRTVKGYDFENPRDWFDELAYTLNTEFIDEEYQEALSMTVYRGSTSLHRSALFDAFPTVLDPDS